MADAEPDHTHDEEPGPPPTDDTHPENPTDGAHRGTATPGTPAPSGDAATGASQDSGRLDEVPAPVTAPSGGTESGTSPADGSSTSGTDLDETAAASEPPAETDPVTAATPTAEATTSDSGDAPGTGASPAEPGSGTEVTGSVGGTIPPWWTWVGKHRKPVVLVVVLVVVAVVGTVVVVSLTRERPQDVVEAYLDAIRAGDTQAALEVAGEPDDDGSPRFLSADALADDWSVDAVVARHVRETEADVDVTISAGGTSQQGRFHMVKGDDGWTMESPFVKVALTVPDLDVVELGGVRQPVKRDETTRTPPLLLFPGVYELYPSLRDRLTFDPALLIATPLGSVDTAVQVTPAYSLTDEGAEAAQKALNASIDECATQAAPNPPGCPFDITESPALWDIRGVNDVVWTVVSHPQAYFAKDNDGGIALVVRRPGTVRVTGTGVPEGGAARTPFALTCEFGFANLAIGVDPDGLTVEHVTGQEYAAALATECF